MSGADRPAPVGVFDSGVGGLTVVRELGRLLPGEDLVYLGDIARSPYGTKSAETITQFALEDAEFLVRRGARLIVVACHSASSVALPELRRRLSVPVMGVVEPGARALVAATRTRRVAVIGTAATIAAGAYERAIHAIAPDVEIVAKSTPLFVPLAEEGWLDGDVAESTAWRYLGGLAGEGIDALLLGCTHFPLLKPVIARVLGSGVTVVDSAAATAEMVAALSLAAPRLAGRLSVYLTDLTPGFPVVSARFLGRPIEEVVRVSLRSEGCGR